MMFRLYKAIIFKKLQSIHNQALRLCLRAFRTLPTQSGEANDRSTTSAMGKGIITQRT